MCRFTPASRKAGGSSVAAGLPSGRKATDRDLIRKGLEEGDRVAVARAVDEDVHTAFGRLGGLIRERDAAVGDVLGLLHHADPRLAQIQAAARARAHDLASHPALGERRLEGDDDLLGALGGTGALGVAVRAAVDADEEIALAKGHGLAATA